MTPTPKEVREAVKLAIDQHSVNFRAITCSNVLLDDILNAIARFLPHPTASTQERARRAAEEIHATPYDIDAIVKGDNGVSVTAAIIVSHFPDALHGEDTELLDWLEKNLKGLRRYKGKWAINPSINYEYDLFPSLRAAIDDARSTKEGGV